MKFSPRFPTSDFDPHAGTVRVRGWASRGVRVRLALGLVAMASSLAAQAADGLTASALAERSGPRGATMFTRMSPEGTGVIAENRYADPRMWGERFHEFEVGAMGTGVAVGDYDGDGRPDIFVVSKTESCRLFRNLGGWKFADVTERAGVADHGEAAAIWKQGAVFADVNNDGRLDLYVCRFGAPNLLYLNQGDGTFRESAHAAGLDVVDACGVGAFCDYDRDGWLDVYVQTNLYANAGHPEGQEDYLFHNNRDGTFTNVTAQAGIRGRTKGHSATWWDYDGDGWPDLYVADDFAPADKLYHNNRDGTFTDVLDQVVPHTPYSAMGSDLGDVNNDGLMDLFVSEMAATTHEKDFRTMAEPRSRAPDPADDDARAPQYYRAALYLNTGTGRCLEGAFLAGVAATDWAWAVRFEDLDDDGRIDLFLTNGMHREIHNADLIQRMLAAESVAERVRLSRASPVLAERNLAFRNLGDLRFQNVAAAWGLDEKGVSFGAAFGDFDGDGDLDLVYTNYQAGPTLLRNDSDSGHRVVVALRGTVSNRFGIGATVRIETDSGPQVRTLVIARGYLSSSEPVAQFGLGQDTRIRRLTVEWPSGRAQVFTDLPVDRRFTITEPPAADGDVAIASHPPPAPFTEVGESVGLARKSSEASVDETTLQPLLPARHDRRGPAVAIGDLDGDGHEDVVVGGTAREPVRILLQRGAGRFIDGAEIPPVAGVNGGPVLLFDANGDGRNDLLLTRGGADLAAGSPEYQPQLYLGAAGGGLSPAPAGTLPELHFSVGAVAAADFDHDGRLDLFVGGRVNPGEYPTAPESALLVRRGGRFENVTAAIAPTLRDVGMVTAALWSDVDGDGWVDLLVALEWGGVKCFHNRHGEALEDWSDPLGFTSGGTGWWNSLAAADFNGDGRLDYVAGNVGLNTEYHATRERPALLFYGQFADDAPPRLVEGSYEGDVLYPLRTRRQLGARIPSILRRYPKNDAYAKASLPDIVGAERLAAARRLEATELASGIFLSQSDGAFRFAPLPRIAQIAPIYGIAAGDFDGDGHADIFAVQNSYAPIPSAGRFDGGLGVLLHGDGRGHFSAVPWPASGLVVPGDAKGLAVADLNDDGWPDFVVTRNNATSLAFENRRVEGHRFLRVSLGDPGGNVVAVGARATLELTDGATETAEVSAGSGYYSQPSADVFFGYPDDNPPRRLRVAWPSGGTTEAIVPRDVGARITVSRQP